MSDHPRDFIDLTNDTNSPPPETQAHPTRSVTIRRANRPPRFDREIISVDAQENYVASPREESPEIEILESRTIPQSNVQSFGNSRHMGRQGQNGRARSPGRRYQAMMRGQMRGQMRDHGVGWTGQLRNLNFGLNILGNEQLVSWENSDGEVFDTPGDLPQDLNFFLPGFDLENPARPTQNPPEPTYEPPSPAKPGFTRSPKEDEELICALCEEELSVGEEDRRRQVWISKACGHVYCGDCATGRSMKKNQGRTKAFSRCVVDGCKKSVSNSKSLIQAYL